jgi:hypothetical protein
VKRKLLVGVISVLLSVILPLGMVSGVLADPPSAYDDTATTDEDTPVNIDVLFNDSDVDGDTLAVTSVTTPVHGAAAIEGDGTVTYTPDADFNGTDSFEYTIDDGTGSTDTATVTVTVGAVNDAPVAVAGGPYEADEGSAVDFDAGGSTDIDSADLQYRWDFDDDGTWDTAWSADPTSSNTWYDDWSGLARVEVSDGLLSDNATATVTVNNVAPTLDPGPDQVINSGESAEVDATFEDPGTLDTHTADIDWDDGSSGPGTVDELGGSGNVTGSHQYLVPGSYTVTVTVKDDDNGETGGTFQVDVEAVIISIDIKPGSDENPINLGSMGQTPVAILTTEDFDAATVNASTVRFGPGQAEPLHYALEDVDEDGDIDMILHFSTQELGLVHDDTDATLSGQTTGGVYFEGTDSVSIVPAKIKDPAPNGKDNAPGQNKAPGSPADGKGKDSAPGQNKGPGSPADGKGKDSAPGQNKAPGSPADGKGKDSAPGQNKGPGSPADGKGKDSAPGQNKAPGSPAEGKGKNK